MQTPSPQHVIDGIEVFVEGRGPQIILMIHGWPDTCRLWDKTIEGLRDTYQCVRFTLPGFDIAQAPHPTTLADMTMLMHRVVTTVSPGAPVTLLLHDWGCIYGYEFAARHTAQVARIIAVDIGDHNAPAYRRSLTVKAKLQILLYQLYLAVAWLIGGKNPIRNAAGNRLTQWMASNMRCRTEPTKMGWQMNYPYAAQWFQMFGGFGNAVLVDPKCPVLYIYGERKPFMFHSPTWLADMATRPGSTVRAFPTGHWVMVQKPAEFLSCIRQWLEV